MSQLKVIVSFKQSPFTAPEDHLQYGLNSALKPHSASAEQNVASANRCTSLAALHMSAYHDMGQSESSYRPVHLMP